MFFIVILVKHWIYWENIFHLAVLGYLERNCLLRQVLKGCGLKGLLNCACFWALEHTFISCMELLFDEQKVKKKKTSKKQYSWSLTNELQMLWIQEPCRLVFRTGCRGGNTQEPPSGHVHPGNHRETEHNPVGFSDLIPLSGWLKETSGTSGFCSLGWLMKSLVAFFFFCGIHFQELLVFLLFYAIDRSSNAEKQCVVYLVFSWWQSFHPTLLLGVRERNCYPVLPNN